MTAIFQRRFYTSVLVLSALSLALGYGCGRVSPDGEAPDEPGLDAGAASDSGAGQGGAGQSGTGGDRNGSAGAVGAGGSAGSTCSNGTLDPDEDCDGAVPPNTSCMTLGLGEGELACNPATCRYDTSGCKLGMPEEPTCEDVTGTLSPSCASPVCTCYPRLLDDCGTDCWTEVACVYRRCNKNPDDPDCADSCPERASIDRPALVECMRSSSWCQVSRCGNGRKEGAELCDGDDLGEMRCDDVGFPKGELSCTEVCTFAYDGCSGGSCGDGVREDVELCDGEEFHPELTCQRMGFLGGDLRCDPLTCEPDTSACNQCGDGHANSNEVCDGNDLKGLSCRRFGFSGGTLRCKDCEVDKSDCSICGNGIAEAGESCDGDDLAEATCMSLGLMSGTLACNSSSCRFDVSGCGDAPTPACGNGLAEAGEECDGDDLVGLDCSALGFEEGALSCRAETCRFDTSACTERPRETCTECRERACQYSFEECAKSSRCGEAIDCVNRCSSNTVTSDLALICFQDCFAGDFDGTLPPNEDQSLVLIANLWGCLAGNCAPSCF